MKTYATFLFFVLCIATSKAQESNQHDIVIQIENLESNQGKIYAALYNDEASFLKTYYQGKTADIKDKVCTVVFDDVPKGVYAVSFFQDLNDNGKMDADAMGIPEEPYGCSNNAQGFMGPPSWEDAKFEVSDATTHLTISL